MSDDPMFAIASVVADMADKIYRVKEMHRPFVRDYPGGDGRTVCNHCLGPVDWPCLTASVVYDRETCDRYRRDRKVRPIEKL